MRGHRSAAARAIGDALALDAATRLGQRLEPLDSDRLTARLARAVRTARDPREGVIDTAELVLKGALFSRELLAGVQVGRDVRGVLRHRDVFALVVQRSRQHEHVRFEIGANRSAHFPQPSQHVVHAVEGAAHPPDVEVPLDLAWQDVGLSECRVLDDTFQA